MSQERAAVYARISDDRDRTALGVARQEEDVRVLAERKGWEVVEVFIDNDISASRKRGKRKVRPAFDQLRKAIEAGDITAVVAYDFDRLFRDPLEQEQFFLLCEQVGQVKVCTIGDDVTIDSGHGLLVARIKGAVAAEEARKIGERITRKHLELAMGGQLSGGGTRPFGYDDDRLTIREGEAVLIRDGVARILAGESIRSIATMWNRQGSTTTAGNPWVTFTLRRVLMSGRICGWREHHGELVAPAAWGAIVDRASLEAVRVVLNDPSRRAKMKPRRYLLTGLIYCGVCGEKLVARPTSRGYRAYCCASGTNFSGCGKIRRQAEAVEDLVVGGMFVLFDTPGFARSHRPARTVDHQAEVEVCEAKLAELAADWASDAISRAEWMHARRAVEERRDRARRQILAETRDLSDLAGQGASLRERWPSMDFDARRPVVERAVDRVTLIPAIRGLNRFDPSKVEVSWRT